MLIEMEGYLPSDPFWEVVHTGAYAAAKDLGVNLQWAAGTNAAEILPQWTSALNIAIARRPAVLLAADFFASAWDPILKKAVHSGIPLIMFNTGYSTWKADGALTYIGEDPFLMGEVGAQQEIAAGAKNGLCVNNNGGDLNQVQRCEGYAEAFKAIGGKTLTLNEATLTDADNPVVVTQGVLGELKSHPDINAVFVIWGDGGADAATAAKESGRHVIVGNVDIDPTGITDIVNGSMLFTIDQQGYLEGYYAVLMAYQYAMFRLIPPEPLYTGPTVINKSNVAQLEKIEATYPGSRGAL
jgi:simple sugar transport system substrate-binding protein